MSIGTATLSTSAFSFSSRHGVLNDGGSSLEVASAFSVPVGGNPEVSGVKVKGASEY